MEGLAMLALLLWPGCGRFVCLALPVQPNFSGHRGAAWDEFTVEVTCGGKCIARCRVAPTICSR